MKKFVYNHAGFFSIVWMLVIFILCATPGQYIPSAHWLDMLSFDKWVHAGMFFVLSCLLCVTAIKNNTSTTVFFFIFCTCVLYGGLLEIMQAKYFSNRSADWQDFAANSFGCLMAMLFLKKLRIFFRAFV